MSMANRRIPELDGLRAFAVLLVVLYHVLAFSGMIPGVPAWLYRFIGHLGPGGVHIFFVISGYIITTLLVSEYQRTGTVSLRGFYTRRFFRIIPPLLVYLAAIFVLSRLNYISVNSANYGWSLLFLGNFDLFDSSPNGGGWFFDHTWSLSVEEQYYLFFPLLLIALRFRSRPVVRLLSLLLIISVLSMKIAHDLSAYVHPAFIHLSAFIQFRYIITGVLAAFYSDRILQLLTRTPRYVPAGLALLILLINSFTLLPILTLFLAVAEPVAYALLVLWFVANPARCTVLRNLLVQRVGAWSYSIYLWQQLFTGPADVYNGWPVSGSFVALPILFACAMLSYTFIEQPSIRLGRRLANRSGQAIKQTR